MSFWKKLFKIELGPEQAKAVEEMRRERQARPPRVRLIPLHGVTFTAEPVAGHAELGQLSVVNLSAQGIGFMKRAGQSWPPLGATLGGTLRLGDVPFTVRAEIRHFSDTVVGCRLTEIPAGYPEAMLQRFFTELSALRMVRVNPSVLQEVEDGAPAFFVGENGCELYYVYNGDGLVRFHLSFFGNYIEAEADGRPVAGSLDESEEAADESSPRHKGSTLVRPAGKVTEDLRQTAERLLSNIHDLDPVIAGQIRDCLSRA